jgi:hypothetical protein
MADSSNNELAGQDTTTPPSWDVNQYQDWPSLDTVVFGLTHDSDADNSYADLGHNSAAKGWYDLQFSLITAMEKLGEVNEAFQKEYSTVKDILTGAAGDAFQEFASKIYSQSEDIYNTLKSVDYPGVLGSVGHLIQAFANNWWAAVNDAHQKEADIAKKAGDLMLQAVTNDSTDDQSTADLQKITTDEQNAYDGTEVDLYGQLRALLANLRDGYQDRGQELTALPVRLPPTSSDGGSTGGGSSSTDGSGSGSSSSSGGSGSAGSGSSGGGSYSDGLQAAQDAIQGLQDGGTSGAGTAGLASAVPAQQTPKGSYSSFDPALASQPASYSSGTADGATAGYPNGYLSSGPGTAGSGSGSTGGYQNGYMSGNPGTAGGGSGSTGGYTTDGSGTAGSGSGSTGGYTTDGSGSAGSGSSGTADAAAQRAQALQDAQNAVKSGIQGVGSSGTDTTGTQPASADPLGQATPASYSTDGSGSAGSGSSGTTDAATQRAQALQDAQGAVDSAFQGLDSSRRDGGVDSGTGTGTSSGSSSPLGDYLNGTSDGTGTSSDVSTQAYQDAKSAVDKAIESMPGYNGTDAYAQGLHDAQSAADTALSGLASGSTPSAGTASGTDVGFPTQSGVPTGGGISDGATSGLGGGGSGGASLAGGIQPVSHLASGGGPTTGLDGASGGGSAATPANAAFDTAASQGLSTPNGSGAQPASAATPYAATASAGDPGSSGMPMSPGMGGGMGGMGQNQGKERQPNTWLQADSGTWGDGHDDHDGHDDQHDYHEPPAVLGRTT